MEFQRFYLNKDLNEKLNSLILKLHSFINKTIWMHVFHINSFVFYCNRVQNGLTAGTLSC